MVACISCERHFFLLLVSPWPRGYAEDEWRQDGRRTLGFSGGHCHGSLLEHDTIMRFPKPNQTLQATAGKRPGWQVGRQRPAVPELFR